MKDFSRLMFMFALYFSVLNGPRHHGNSNQGNNYNSGYRGDGENNQDSNSERWQVFSPLARQDEQHRKGWVFARVIQNYNSRIRNLANIVCIIPSVLLSLTPDTAAISRIVTI